MEARSRIALWCIALFLCISLQIKSRLPSHRGGEAAFLRPGANTVTVRLAGDLPRPGVFYLPTGTSAAAAIKMTVAREGAKLPAVGETDKPLASGDVVTLTARPGKNAVISITKMGVRERMLLGVPLEPDRLTAEEWELLPGVGPALSARIIDDRHKNGAFGSVDDLLRVPGIGPGKLEALRKYF